MKKYRCGKCGMTFEGKLEICPGCGAELHYVDAEIKLQSEAAINETSVSTFRFDDDDVIKTGIPENEDALPTVQEQYFESQHNAKYVDKRGRERAAKEEIHAVNPEKLLSLDSSYYDGKKVVKFFMTLGLLLLCLVTAFIAVPWALTIKYRYDAKHTVLSGYRLTFDGRGSQLFGRYILWLFLTIITASLFLFWLTHFMKKWKTKHTLILKKEA